MTYWPVVMIAFAGISSGFAFYYSMTSVQSDVEELKSMWVREERITLEFELRDKAILDLKESLLSWKNFQQDINRDFEDDIKYLHRSAR
jgi:hypothetical protein